MTQQQIKDEVSSLYEIIKKSEDRLKEIRETICKHENTYEADYSYRIGATFPAVICDDCGEVVEMLIPKF